MAVARPSRPGLSWHEFLLRIAPGRGGAVALIALLGPVSTAVSASSLLVERLTETIATRLAADGVTGAVVVLIEAGAPVWTGAFGMADAETGRVMTEDAVFRVESLSKPIAAWGAMRLAESGRLDLDAPISTCLSRWIPSGEAAAITPRQLLSHTAGLGLGDFTVRFSPGAGRPTLPEHVARDLTVIGPPGRRFSYSDTGYSLLELVIEDCSGEDFAVLMAREVLAPLGMPRASFEWTGARMPAGHDLRQRPVAAYVYPARASGGLQATAADIARFVAAGMTGAAQQVLSSRGVAELHRPAVEVGGLFGFAADAYGLGHFVETLSDGRTAIWHGGQGHGWMSHLHFVPESGTGIVILSNSQRAWPLFAAILRDWSEHLGVAPVGMARVLCAETAARVSIAVLLTTAVMGFWIAHRRPSRPRLARIGVCGLASGLILWPLWAAAQDWLFLFSILPGLWPWLAAASVLAGIGLAAMALVPEPRCRACCA